MTRNFKGIFLAGVFLAIFGLVTLNAIAQERPFDVRQAQRMETSAERRAELMNQAEESRMELRQQAEERRAEVQTRIQERQERRIEFQREMAERRVENTKRVISATIKRLSSIADRVESRIEKLRVAGGDTSLAETYLAAARADLTAATASVAEFDNLDLSSDNAQENFEFIRIAAQEAKEHIRSAHRNLALSVSSFSNSVTNQDESDDDDDDDEEDVD